MPDLEQHAEITDQLLVLVDELDHLAQEHMADHDCEPFFCERLDYILNRKQDLARLALTWDLTGIAAIPPR